MIRVGLQCIKLRGFAKGMLKGLSCVGIQLGSTIDFASVCHQHDKLQKLLITIFLEHDEKLLSI